ncbi:MAG: hypothetical protein HUJ76_10915, partial [Parasporobacterium sp.]|nr:hypothetical protein [Parasporobacterium sp.]
MKRDFSQAQIEELWRIADQNQAELYNMATEKVEEGEMLEAAAELWVVEQYLNAVKEREAMTVKKLEQIVVNLKEADQTYGDYLQTLNQQLDAYDQRLRSVAELLQPEKLSMNNDQYQRELQAISERYSKTKDNSEIVKLELWLTSGYQLDEKELKEAREMVEAYFALGTDEGRVYYEDMYSPVDESIYADWTEIHWKKFQLMGALDKKIGTWNSFGNGVVEAVPFWGTLSDVTMKTQAGLRGYKFEEICLSDNVFTNSHIQHPYVTFGGNLTGGLLTYELAAGAAGNIPGLAQRINSISGRLSAYPILNRIGQDHISNIIGATVIDTGVLTLPGAIGDIARGESPGNVFKNAGLDMGRNLLFNIGGEAISGALGAVLKRGESGSNFKGQLYNGTRNPDVDFVNGKGKSTLNKHAGKHGYTSPEEYLKDARNFLEKKPTSTIQSFVSNVGTYFRYDTATNEFGIIN